MAYLLLSLATLYPGKSGMAFLCGTGKGGDQAGCNLFLLYCALA